MNVRRNLRVRDISGLIESRLWAQILVAMVVRGIALLAGAWLGGDRGILLMQSSGVGNCVNMLTLIENCRMPLVALITMRGEWGEFNPWQARMGQATPDVLTRMGVQTHRVDDPDDAAPTLDVAIRQSFDGSLASAVLLSQRLIGRKAFKEDH